MQGWERAINTLTDRSPQPQNTNPWNERRERDNSRRYKDTDPALETRQSLIKNIFTKICLMNKMQESTFMSLLYMSWDSKDELCTISNITFINEFEWIKNSYFTSAAHGCTSVGVLGVL